MTIPDYRFLLRKSFLYGWLVCSVTTITSMITIQSFTLAQDPIAAAISEGRVVAESERPLPVPPQLAERSTEGEEAISSFRVPDGWKVQLFAAEPDVANIVAFDIDNTGRVFVCESFRQNRGVTDNRGHDETWLKRDLAAQTVQDRIAYHLELLGEEAKAYTEQDDRIRVLEDTRGAGKADKVTIFADGFNRLEDGTGAGVLVRGNTAFYTNIPRLYQLVDTNADGAADQRIVLSEGYGVRVAFRGHDMHGLVLGPDGRLYFSIGDRGYHVITAEGKLLHDPASGAVFRCELDGSKLEVFATGLRNPQELAFNDYGDLFTGDNNSDSGDKARIVHVLRGGDTGWRMYYQYLPDRGPFNRDKIWEPFHDAQPAYIVPPVANFADGPSGLTYYPGTGFGEQLADTFLLADFRGGAGNSGIRTFKLEPHGAFYSLGQDSQQIWSILATDVMFGPDGGLYVSDWVNGWDGEGKGRIYKITDPNFSESLIVKEVQRLLASDWASYDSGSLSLLMNHRDRRIRLEAQWELANRQAIEVLMDFALDDSHGTVSRLHAVWGIGQILRKNNVETDNSSISAATIAAIRKLLDDSDPYVRAATAEIAGEHKILAVQAELASLISDSSPRVGYFATLAVADHANRLALENVIQMLAENDNRDPALRHAGIMAFSSIASAEQLAGLANHPSANVRRAAVVALRRLGSPLVSQYLADGDLRVLGEAARAIHDAPIPEAMAGLAAMIARPVQDAEVTRRVLNANFRLGQPEHALALSLFAGRDGIEDSLKIDSLDLLAAWGKPDARDRILNDWRPLAERNVSAAATALQSNLAAILSSSEQTRNRAIALAAELGLSEVTPLLIQRLEDPTLEPEARAAALNALSRLEPDSALLRAKEVLQAPRTTNKLVAVQLLVAAINAVARANPVDAANLLIDSTKTDRPVEQQQAAWDALSALKNDKATTELDAAVDSWIAGTLPPEVMLNVQEAVSSFAPQSVQDKLAAKLADVAQQDPLAAWRPMLLGGDPQAGEVVFFTKTELSCVRCHKVGSQGGEVGPDLTEIAKEKDRTYLLEAIVYPDAQIAKGYETTVLADDAGTIHTGIVKTENDETIDLIKADGSQVRLNKEEIVGRRRGQSAMPSDLTKYMTRRELRDLVAYLATLDKPAGTEEGGHKVK